jgi:AraC-like DNA-binding protein
VNTPHSVFAGIDFTRGRLYRSRDLDEVRQACGRVFNPHDLRVLGRSQRLDAGMDHLRFGGLSLNRLHWGAEVAVDPDRLGDYYLISMPIRGHARFELGGRITEVSPRCAGLVNASQRFRFTASRDFEQLVVRLDLRAIESGWSALAGEPPARAIDFDCALPIDAAAWGALLPALAVLARRALGDAVALPHLDARLEELLVSTLLLHQPHTHDDRLPRAPGDTASAAQVRRAEDYMRENLEEALTLGEIARAIGTSTRTLQARFQAHHALGPMQWLREQRLQAVRTALLGAGDAPVSVAEAALRFGFSHLGEFSQAYRRRFGETARETLRRAR